MLIIIAFLLLFSGCSSSPSSANLPAAANAAAVVNATHAEVGPASIDQSSPDFFSAQRFDKYVHNQFTADEIKTLKTNCRRQRNFDRFCSSYLNASLSSRIHVKMLPPHAPEPKQIKQVSVIFKNGKIVNWKKLRKEKIPSLLKAMNGFTLEQVQAVSALALKESRCPNGFAIAAGASLEDYLPERVANEDIARLYEKAARCFPRASVDRENFLSRAALLYYEKGQLKEAARVFNKVNPSDAFSGRSLYWSYRINKEIGNSAAAQKAFDRLFSRYRFSFHALVAASLAGLDAGSDLLSEKAVAIKRSVKNRAVNKLVEAVELLHQYDFQESAAILASWTLDHYHHTEPEVKVYLAELGDPPLQVTWIPQLLIQKPTLIQRETMQMAYPKAFYSIFEKQQTVIDPFLLMALARKESRFDPKAISPTNAQGLLQIQPETAKKLQPTAAYNLLDPSDNITMGSHYLADLILRLNGNLPLALGSYNAGEDAVKSWLRRFPTTDTVLFIDLIPYRETRDYVAYVLANYFWYVRNYGQPSQDPIKKLVAVAANKGN